MFCLQLTWVVKTVWSMRPEIFIMRPFTEEFANSYFRFENDSYEWLLVVYCLFFFNWLYHLCLNALDILLFDFFSLVTDVHKVNLERSKENECNNKDQIKKRKKKRKDYQPNYFLSIPITNKEVLFFLRSIFTRFYSKLYLRCTKCS